MHESDSNRPGSNRGQKDVIIRKNSSKTFVTRPTSKGGKQEEGNGSKKLSLGATNNLSMSGGLPHDILNNSSFLAHTTNLNSPQNLSHTAGHGQPRGMS